VHRVDQLDSGGPDGVGRRQHLVFTTRLPYRLGFDLQTHRVQAPTILEAVATGELEGVGRWTLSPDDGWTLVRYNWDVHTTTWWMNLLAPIARPAFTWNHDALMLDAANSLARQLGAQLELSNAAGQPRRPTRTLAWGGLLAALLLWSATQWRRRASHTDAKPQPSR
jgi:hypothetical protein